MEMMKSFMFGVVVILLGITFFGCGTDIGELSPKSTERVFRDGRIYVVYNARPTTGSRTRILVIVYEGQRIIIPPNMTERQEPTMRGAVQITPDPLPGGVVVDFEFEEIESATNFRKLSDFFNLLGGPVIIDGDITIEFYDENWDALPFGVLVIRVIPGRYDGPHIYR